MSTTLISRGRKPWSLGSIPSHRVWKRQPTEWLLMGWDSWRQHDSRAVPRDNDEIPPHSKRIISHRRVKTSCLPLRLHYLWTKKPFPRVNTSTKGVETPTTFAFKWLPEGHSASAEWEPPFGQLRGRAANGKSELTSLG